ncbi:hypothetical protein L9F63_011255 [Diploptera punctata]|uniref:Peptidase S1 domain-containing protein n=1 Tax=Diploptera punctata TaxID=6984 RepID=A0AAD8AF92_DIPPU|nr:hypothetical protein L9F63_011255 [Diploptera punctata]
MALKMQKFLIIGSLMVASCLEPSSSVSHNDVITAEIVGGQNANIEDYPYQLSLEKTGKHICGASIITNDYAVTAAHCVFLNVVEDLKLRSGTSFRQYGGYLHPVSSITMHPKYKNRKLDYDIAVVKVKIPFAYGKQSQPVALASKNPSIGTVGIVTGFGQINEDGPVRPAQLQQLQVPIVSPDLCKQIVNDTLTSNMICAGISGGEGFCFGDSGGPLVINGALVGIVSFMLPRCDDPYPQVYADVPAMLEFVQSVFKNSTNY